jgi:hypothetical protein
MTDARIALLYVALLVPLVVLLLLFEALLATGRLNTLGAPPLAVAAALSLALVVMPFVTWAVIYFRVAGWAHRRYPSSAPGGLAHLGRCAALYVAVVAAAKGVHRQAQTDVSLPWSFVSYLALLAIGGALCGIILAERRAAATSHERSVRG